MSTASIRQIKLARLRAQLKDDAHSRVALVALDAADAARTELELRRQSLVESNLYSAAGVHAQLADIRKQHATALRKHADSVRSSAETLVAAGAAKVELPADHARILQHYLDAPPARQQEMRLRALSGRDEEMARVLIHPSNARFTELTPAIRTHIEQRYTDAAVAAANAPRLEALALANEVVSELTAQLEG